MRRAARLGLALSFFDTVVLNGSIFVVIIVSIFLMPLIVVLRRTISTRGGSTRARSVTSRRVASRNASTKRSVLSIIVSIGPS